MSKADKAVILAREKEIVDLLNQGVSGGEICKTLADKHKVSVKAIQRVYYRVVKALQQIVEQERGEIRAKLMLRNDYIYQRAIANNNYRIALSANEAIAKLAGLDRIEPEEPNKPKFLVLKERDVEGLPSPESTDEPTES